MEHPRDPRHLCDATRTQLLEEIRTGIYSGSNRLPPENELAEHFGVSRNMMRECLTQLEREGMVNRRRGVGTLINRRIVSAENRLDLVSSLDTTLYREGYQPTTAYLEVRTAAANQEIADNLEIQLGASLLVVERLVLASGKPAVYITDYIPWASLPQRQYQKQDFMPSIFSFLRDQINAEVYLNLTELRALGAPEKVAEYLQVKKGAPLLFLGEIGFDFGGRALVYSEEYLIDRIIRQQILRKKI